MNILLLSPIYLPEQSPISYLLADLVDGLVKKGHSVEIVTGIPSLLVEEKTSKSSLTFSIEKTDNRKVYRLPLVKGRSNHLLSKIMGYYRFRILANLYKKNFSKPDVIYAPVPSNETGMAAKSLAKYFNCRYIINVQDIHPDAIFNLGIIRMKFLKNLLKMQEIRMYKGAHHVTVIGDTFKKNLKKKGIVAPISVIPNWVKLDDYKIPKLNHLRQEWGIEKDKFVVLYAGTFGRIHGTSVILDAAKILLDDNDIIFLLVGHGYDFELMKKQSKKRNLHNVILKEYVPRAKLAQMQSISSVSLVTLRPELGYSSIPSKVLGYMASSRPVIAMTEKDSDVGNLVKIAECGLVIPPGDTGQLARLIKELKGKKKILKRWGKNGFRYLEENFEKENLISDINKIIITKQFLE